ncbi:stage II sporulation protein D [Thermanaeromonas toyohensis ToBE]|uniref:Stage II sporulation protein D n=1 Tax=Thermanaeromonas toyohensis ToBE TaxID=698762 RepID=A0A1W1V8B8_9FIRM|nr:SpoIID/LytB domain-containing protein [Thermanaeromonas toyohensis]SMB89486.1 stage II sporulation protein D [Thermanaeromonas toyohensis ToBE]
MPERIRRWTAFTLLVALALAIAVGAFIRGGRAFRRPLGVGQEPTISLYLHKTGETKSIKMEDYIQGVVAAEMDPNWPVNALAAQAILARTFTLKKVQEGGVKARGTDASTSTEEFQAYAPEKINDNVRRAVENTRGLVVKSGGRLINAWFHAAGGPQTAASAVEGLDFHQEPAPYVHSVKDPGLAIAPPEDKAWSASFSKDELATAVRKITGQDPGPITSVRIAEKGPSGRATKIEVGKLTVSGPALRLALGSDRLRSTFITGVEVRGNRVIFRGQGYGHGVGMSQWGARALAEQGKSPEEIIKYFFKDVTLEKAW